MSGRAPAAGSPECESVGATNRGSAGAERPPSSFQIQRPFGARVGVLPCRGCDHIVSDRPIPTRWRFAPGSGVQDRRATALVTVERRCRRASAQSVAILRSLGPRPRIYRGRAGPRGTRANGNIHAASSGSPVLPRVRRSSLTRPSDGQDAGSMGEEFWGRISVSE